MIRINLDTSDRTTVLVCSCGWRTITTGPHRHALTLAAMHEKDAHPGHQQTRQRLRQDRQRYDHR